AQHLTVRLPARRVGRPIAGQDPVRVLERYSVPGPETVAQAENLPVAWSGGQRRRVQVVHHDLTTGRQRERAALIRAQARREHLLELLAGRAGAPLARMAELLDLGRERARADWPALAAQLPEDVEPDRLAQAVPLHGGVEARALRVQQLAVL